MRLYVPVVIGAVALSVAIAVAAYPQPEPPIDESLNHWDYVEFVKDSQGVTMVDYKNLYELRLGRVYNPAFIDTSDWFLDNYHDYGGYYMIPHDYRWFSLGNVSAPWYSCEAQSQALAVTAKAYRETGDQKYLDFSEKVLASFAPESVMNDKGWFAGLVSKERSVSILNSQMICMIALHDYYEQTDNAQALEYFGAGLETLEQNIGRLTDDCGTYYLAERALFKPHSMHPEYIGLLGRIYEMTGSDTLKATLDKWRADYESCD